MKRYMFLDIDGVLASYEFLKTRRGFIDPDKIALLNQLEGVEIVISSSWGYDNGRTEKTLRGCGLKLPIVGYTDHFHTDWFCRGNEIEKWLHDNCGGMCTKYGLDGEGIPYYKHSNTDYEYVIVDDDTDMLLGQKDNFVHVDREFALQESDIEKIKTILKLKKDE